MYCLQSNELLSPLLFFDLQLLSLSTLLHLFCDDAKRWPTVFCHVSGKIVESATGSAVGSNVASVEGVQPWLIAPGCMSQSFPWSMMMPSLAETQLLDRLLLDTSQEGVSLKIMLCVSEFQNLFKLLLVFYSTWQPYVFLLVLRHILCIVQHQVSPVGIRTGYQSAQGWHQWPLEFIKEAMIQIYYPFLCSPSTCGNINSRFLSCIIDPCIVCTKFCYYIMA